MKVANNIEMLEVHIPRGGGEMIVYPTLIWDDSHLLLFDTGIPGSGKYFAEAIKAAGQEPSALTDIILTHQDVDHIGGAKEILALAPKAKVYAHEVDTPFIDGRQTPTKLAALEDLATAGNLPDERKDFYAFLKNGFTDSFLPVNVELKDGDVLDFAGGIETVFTPGHTPGHAAFYLKFAKIMIVGDAANISNGKLQGSNPAMTWDNDEAEKSLAKIKSYELNGIISYHTGFLKY
jgi:glyoxylase-like metal-dependent hydrolase (beta-lactamase superfamily II)